MHNIICILVMLFTSYFIILSCMYVYIYIVYICASVYVCTGSVYTSVYVYIRTSQHIFIYLYVCVHVCTCASLYLAFRTRAGSNRRRRFSTTTVPSSGRRSTRLEERERRRASLHGSFTNYKRSGGQSFLLSLPYSTLQVLCVCMYVCTVIILCLFVYHL